MFLSKFKIKSQEDLVETPTAIHAEKISALFLLAQVLLRRYPGTTFSKSRGDPF